MSQMKKAAVLGAGVMGSGIAAHLANAGLEVVLLDVSSDFAAEGRRMQLKAGGFMDASFAARVLVGSIKNDLSLLSDADWIVEAVVEDVNIKRTLYESVNNRRKPGAIMSSNTSTIPLAKLTEGLPDDFAQNFLITHFFNPPRHMKLLELVRSDRTDSAIVSKIRQFADVRLGKTVVECKDSPGFIANRLGAYWLAVALNESIAADLPVEDIDQALSRPFGVPSTGIFGLLDLVGIDLIATIIETLQSALPVDDHLQQLPARPDLVRGMIAQKRIGRKSGEGFGRTSEAGAVRESIVLSTGEYRPYKTERLEIPADPKQLMLQESTLGRLAALVMSKTLAYAAHIIPDAADTAEEVDIAMQAGYGWKFGPFELIDRLGAGWVTDRLKESNSPVPRYLQRAAQKGSFYVTSNGGKHVLDPFGDWERSLINPDALTIASLSNAGRCVADWTVARMWDLEDGVAGLEFCTKMNSISPDLLKAIGWALERTKSDFNALVIGSDSPIFSAGADLKIFTKLASTGDTAELRRFLELGQTTLSALRTSPFPVVGAAGGKALGGGCEVLLHCDAIQAHCELSMGLVETRIGLIPAWGGCKEMLSRFVLSSSGDQTSSTPALRAYQLISQARVSKGAFDARNLGYLKESDGITMNRDRLLSDAKQRARVLSTNYNPHNRPEGYTGSRGDADALIRMAKAQDDIADSIDDASKELAHILAGGMAPLNKECWEEEMLGLERDSFIRLALAPGAADRMLRAIS